MLTKCTNAARFVFYFVFSALFCSFVKLRTSGVFSARDGKENDVHRLFDLLKERQMNRCSVRETGDAYESETGLFV